MYIIMIYCRDYSNRSQHSEKQNTRQFGIEQSKEWEKQNKLKTVNLKSVFDLVVVCTVLICTE